MSEVRRGRGAYTALATCFVRHKSDIWVGFGQSAEWPSGITPTVNPTVLPNPIIYKKINICRLAKYVSPPVLPDAPTPYLTGGTLNDATYYYVFTQYGAFGQLSESIASAEYTALIVNGTGHGSVIFDLTNAFSSGVTSCRVYRGTSSGSKTLIAIIEPTEQGTMPTSWTDDGSDPDASNAVPPGSYSINWDEVLPNNTIVSRYLEYIDEETATSVVGRIVYMSGTLTAGDGGIADITYRAVSFNQGLIPVAGHENDTILLAANVESAGNVLAVKHYDYAQNVQGSAIEGRAFQVGG